MKRNYHTPTCSTMSTVLKRSLLLSISGQVENPEESDIKTRDFCIECEKEEKNEWGQLW
jgi:hypothetical protein